eukprot:3399762-Amphidinium_carterae.1
MLATSQSRDSRAFLRWMKAKHMQCQAWQCLSVPKQGVQLSSQAFVGTKKNCTTATAPKLQNRTNKHER